ncbi:MAG: sporulation protein YabP [Clostridia bacterium]|nr:sporulation protein YabP [Clostridia bacterium]
MTEHNVVLKGRKHLEIGGAVSVLSFDENSVVIKSTMGICCVQGNSLSVSKLDCDGGDIHIDGEIVSFYYPEQTEEKQSFISRIFK